MRKLLLILLAFAIVGAASALPYFGPAQGFHTRGSIQVDGDITVVGSLSTGGANITNGVIQNDIAMLGGTDFSANAGSGKFDWRLGTGDFNTTNGTNRLNGPVEAAQILRDAKDAGLSDITLRRAKTALKIVTKRQGEPGRRGGGKYLWELPDLGDHTDLVEHLNQNTLKIETFPTTDDHLNTPTTTPMDLGDQGEHLNAPVVVGTAAVILGSTDFLEGKGERL